MGLMALLDNRNTINSKASDTREEVACSPALSLSEDYIAEQFKELQKGYMKLLADY